MLSSLDCKGISAGLYLPDCDGFFAILLTRPELRVALAYLDLGLVVLSASRITAPMTMIWMEIFRSKR